MRITASFVLLSAALALAACGEKPQTAGGQKKVDGHAWEGTGNGYAAAGWKSGDQASWEQQLRTRSQGQNEYARAAQP